MSNAKNGVDVGPHKLLFFLNGKRVELSHFEPATTLLHYVREKAGLTGSKLGCGEGGCGACTVMISHYSPSTDSIVHRAVNGCLMPLAAVDGMAVTTIEGLGNTRDGLNPVQERIAESHGSQCGFCTPGIVMSLYAYLRSHPRATKEEIEDSLDGNLCRCTGYRPILDAAKTFAWEGNVDDTEHKHENVSHVAAELVQQGATPPADGAGICPSTGQPCDCGKQQQPAAIVEGTTQLTGNDKPKGYVAFDPNRLTTHLIFPPALKKYALISKTFTGEQVTWYQPVTYPELLSLKKQYPEAKLVTGNTEIGIDRKFRNMKFPVAINPVHVPELNHFSVSEEGVEIGAALTITELQRKLLQVVSSQPGYKTHSLTALLKQLRWFAGNQIRNVACIGGNICTASPISDINPVLIAANATLRVESEEGKRDVPIREFFLRYRVVDLQPGEVLRTVFLPFTRENEYFHAYKQARRRDDDISIVTSGIRVLLSQTNNAITTTNNNTTNALPQQWQIDEIYFGYGGMAPKTVYCPQTEQALRGKVWDASLIPIANEWLEKDLPLPANAPGGMIQYRRTLTTSFFYKFFLRVSQLLHPESVSERELSAIPDFHKAVSHGKQTYHSRQESYPVSFPVVHAAANKQVTGEALYSDDVPTNAYHGVFVGSKRAHANILSIDATLALEAPEVVGFFSAKDIPGYNEVGPVIRQDEELFASHLVTAIGQPIGLIVATSHEAACEAALLVQVEYEDLVPIITIQQAIKERAFQGDVYWLEDGDVKEAFKQCEHVITGEIETGAQEHFYLEPNCTLVTPTEGREMRVVCSSQNPTKTQQLIAHVLGVPENQITVSVKRMGGGFGGKETRSIFTSCAAAVAAARLNKAVKVTLDRDVDMTTTGMRHPYLGQYKVGFNNDGTIQALKIDMYSNGGNSMDLSFSVMERALFHVDNCYKIPNVKATGRVCKTNIASNTAFRGFGGPQSMLICETWMEHVAHTLKKDINEIRRKNFYQDQQATHYKQVPSDNHIHRLFDELLHSAEFSARTEQIAEFNKNNRWKKRGIAVVPTKFGMSFTVKFLNQAGALVHVYQDGSVLVSHAGAEMGQGIHTKIIQIAAHALQVSMDKVHISETATDKVANTSPTAASVQSDINGMAVLRACEIILERLGPLRKDYPDYTWEQLVWKAYLDRVDLTAHGFYATPDVGYDFHTHTGKPFNYFVWGASCSEVEIDVLTGDHVVLRADVLMDLGESLNPAIDIGQIEGAFVQGMGWTTLEQVVWFENGFQFTRGPGTYKIPSFNDVPVDFRVGLLKDSANVRAVHSSKGVGEPPFFLAASVFFAIKNACIAARTEAGLPNEYFQFNAPATAERIRIACVDQFTKQFD